MPDILDNPCPLLYIPCSEESFASNTGLPNPNPNLHALLISTMVPLTPTVSRCQKPKRQRRVHWRQLAAHAGQALPVHPSHACILSVSVCRRTRTGLSTILLSSIPWTGSLCKHNENQQQNFDPLPHHALSLLCLQDIAPSFGLHACMAVVDDTQLWDRKWSRHAHSKRGSSYRSVKA